MNRCGKKCALIVCLLGSTWLIVGGTDRPPCEIGVEQVKVIRGTNPTWDGSVVELEAVPPRGRAFASRISWSATKGSFVGGSTGKKVTWRAPADGGGNATITARACGSSATIEVMYVYLEFLGDMPTVLRGRSHSFQGVVQPADAPVRLEVASGPDDQVLSLTVDGLFVTAKNIIEESNIEAFAERAVGNVRAILDDLPKLDFYVLELSCEKMFAGFVEGYLPLGERPWNLAEEALEDVFQENIEAQAVLDGLPTMHAGEVGRRATRALRENILNHVDPFGDVDVTDGRIPESWKYKWGVDLEVGTALGRFELNDGDFELGDWLQSLAATELSVNSASGMVQDVSTKLKLTVTGGSWKLSTKVTGSAGNASGSWNYELGAEVRLIFEFD